MTSAPRLLLVAVVASCALAACSLKSLDYLHNGEKQDGALGGEPEMDASISEDAAGSSVVPPDETSPDSAVPTVVIDALPDFDSASLDSQVPDSLVVGARDDVGKDQRTDTSSVDPGSPDSARLDATELVDALVNHPVLDAFENLDSASLNVPVPDVSPSLDSASLNVPVPDASPNLDSAELDSSIPDSQVPDLAPDLSSPVPDGPAGKPSVLFVVGSTTLSSADSAIQKRLVNNGYTVTLVDDNDLASVTTVTTTMVLISATVGSGNVTTKFRTTAKPVMVWEPMLYDDMGFLDLATNEGHTTVNGSTIDVSATGGELAAGLIGTVSVFSAGQLINYGIPNAQALLVATVTGQPTNWSILAYETGVQMPGLVAPARRVGFFLTASAAPSLTADGWKLFDAAVAWLAKSH